MQLVVTDRPANKRRTDIATYTAAMAAKNEPMEKVFCYKKLPQLGSALVISSIIQQFSTLPAITVKMHNCRIIIK